MNDGVHAQGQFHAPALGPAQTRRTARCACVEVKLLTEVPATTQSPRPAVSAPRQRGLTPRGPAFERRRILALEDGAKAVLGQTGERVTRIDAPIDINGAIARVQWIAVAHRLWTTEKSLNST